jgi:hypothetical protein
VVLEHVEFVNLVGDAYEIFNDMSLENVIWDEEPIHKLHIIDQTVLADPVEEVNSRERLSRAPPLGDSIVQRAPAVQKDIVIVEFVLATNGR